MAKHKRKGLAPEASLIGEAKLDWESQEAEIAKIIQSLPSGKVAILASESARYTAFTASLSSLMVPANSRYDFLQGCYVVDSCNNAVARMHDHEDWIMFMGDDHVFPPWFALNLLQKMYKYDLDVLAPLCFRRSFPPSPVVFTEGERDEARDRIRMVPINLDDYPEGGIIEVHAAGSAGMIVRRRVLESFGPPWFVLGGEKQEGEDIYFCRRIREQGFKIWVDLGIGLGHIVNTTIWPRRADQGWGVQYDYSGAGGYFMPLAALEGAAMDQLGYVNAESVGREEILSVLDKQQMKDF